MESLTVSALSSTAGHVCLSCGMWDFETGLHVCQTTTWVQSGPDWERIYGLLERIAVALEKKGKR